MLFKTASALAFLSLACASPVLERRLDTSAHCGQWDTVTAGNYELLLDQWGAAGASSGSDCANIVSQSGSTIAWTTTYDWVGGTGIKSFTNMQLNAGLNKQLSAISSMQTSWNWAMSNSGSLVADVAYDIFTSATSGGSSANEIMIWLANYNAGPISSQYSSSGQPVAIQSSVSIAGHTWNLYSGSNGANAVYSFLPTSGTITSFSGDAKAFFTYLIGKGYISSSQYLTTFQAGTEITTGSGTLKTSSYSAVIS